MNKQIWVEIVGSIIIARMRGVLNEEILTECQERVLQLVSDTHRGKVLYDGLEVEPPPAHIVFTQQKLDQQLAGIHLKRAIVVPNSKIAYLARIAFAEGDYRVFYNDMTEAINWLQQ